MQLFKVDLATGTSQPLEHPGLEESIKRITSEDNLMRRMVYERELYDDLIEINAGLNKFVDFLKGDDIHIRKLRLWGKNPTKKKQK